MNHENECAAQVLACIENRRSVRRYTQQPVTQEQLKTIVHAGMCAPTAVNRRPFAFVVIQNPETLTALSRANKYAHMLEHAAAGIVVCGLEPEEKHPEFLNQDCAAAIQNMLLAVHAMGLGAVWCGIETHSEWEALLAKMLELPAGVCAMGVVALGHPAEEPAQRDNWTPEKLHWEQW